MQRDLLRPWADDRRRPPGLSRRGRRPLRRDLEPGLHAVRARRGRHDDAAAQTLGRYRHGARAHRRGHAGSAFQLRHRPVQEPDPCRRQARRDLGADLELAARDRRSHPRQHVPHRRRRAALQRRPRLRAAPDHPPRHPSRLQARHPGAVLLQAGHRARAGDGGGVPRTHARPRAGRARAEAGGGALRGNPRQRHGAARERDPQSARREDDRRRHRLQALRYLRLSRRPDGRHRTRARAQHRSGTLRCGHGGTAAPLPGGEQVRRRSAGWRIVR